MLASPLLSTQWVGRVGLLVISPLCYFSKLMLQSLSLVPLPCYSVYFCLWPILAQFPPPPCWPTAPEAAIVNPSSDWFVVESSFFMIHMFDLAKTLCPSCNPYHVLGVGTGTRTTLAACNKLTLQLTNYKLTNSVQNMLDHWFNHSNVHN